MAKGRRFVIGDLHGCVSTFREMTEVQLRLRKEDTLFLLGDYIDRGPDSKGVVDHILDLQKRSYRVVPIMGNHEYMLLNAVDDEEEFGLWEFNGSFATLISFGIDASRAREPGSVHEIPGFYIDFFRNLPIYAETPGFVMVHAGIGHDKQNPFDPDFALWTREEYYNRQLMNGRRLVHGHTPFSLASIRERVHDPEEKFINLDGGCVYNDYKDYGNLVALDLDSLELYVQENIEGKMRKMPEG
jgi:serine/threonine protein phosphatase 1